MTTIRPDDDTARTAPLPAGETNAAVPAAPGHDELVAFLNQVLEAERAGVQVTLQTARAAGAGPLGELMRAIQRDEAHWCAMLHRHIKALGEAPSPKIGAFYQKAMAIADVGERVTFLNRGQGWVVRKLQEMLARLPDNALRADLADMLRSHEDNITLANDIAGPAPVITASNAAGAQ